MKPLTEDEKKDILVKAVVSCREKDMNDLFEEICSELKRLDIKPEFDLVNSILNI